MADRKYKTCEQCGKTFFGKNRKYCSRNCYEKSKIRYCLFCGKELLLKGKKKNQFYCSQKCMAEAYRSIKDKKCLHCGKELKGSWGNPVPNYRRFCSFSCYRKYIGESSLEGIVREYLEKLGYSFETQVQFERYVVDFLLPQHKRIIEADGEYWHRDTT